MKSNYGAHHRHRYTKLIAWRNEPAPGSFRVPEVSAACECSVIGFRRATDEEIAARILENSCSHCGEFKSHHASPSECFEVLRGRIAELESRMDRFVEGINNAFR